MSSSSAPAACDTLVIGAGTLGLMTALRLAERGVDVTVLERGAPMGEASGVNAGSLAAQNKMLAMMPHTLAALKLWEGMADYLGAEVGFARVGGLRVAMNGAERDMLERSAAEQARIGVPIEWLEGDALRRRASFLGEQVVAASHASVDCFANPLLFAPALLGRAVARGVQVHDRSPVAAIEPVGDGYVVKTGTGAIYRCGRLVIAAGAWSGEVARQLGLVAPVKLDVNMIGVTAPSDVFMQGVVTHVRGILTLKQVANGTLLIGGGWIGKGTLADGRKDLDYESSLHNVRLAVRVVPAIARRTLVRQWAGYEGATPDSCPYLGAIPGCENAYMLACARGGWTLAPILSKMLTELMMDHDTELPHRAFSPGRFAHG